MKIISKDNIFHPPEKKVTIKRRGGGHTAFVQSEQTKKEALPIYIKKRNV